MVDQKKLLVSIGATAVVLLLIVGITLAIVLPGRNSDSETETEIETVLPRKKLVIDHDGGADDALAITMALIYEKYFDGPNVVALTTTFGNVNWVQAFFNSDRILALMNRQDIPIYKGSSRALISGIESDNYFGNDGLGDTGYRPPPVTHDGTPAVIALHALSEKYRENLTIVAIGPLTNIALAVRTDPEFLNRIGQLYVGAGQIHSDVHPNPEFNAAMDPEAYHMVANNTRLAGKVTIVPFSQVYNTLSIPVDWRINTLGKLQTKTIEELNTFEQISLPKEPTWTHLDPATMAIALDTDLVDVFRDSTNDIILQGANRGINTNDFSSPFPTSRLLQTANVEKYKKFLLDVYSAEL